ncbi:MAG: signal peptidase I [Clostridia bacterium]|nr:signal peptidase I [Clostridia bacterium]
MANVNKEKIKKIAEISVNVLIWIVVVMSLFITILVFSAQGSKDGVPSIFGKSLVTIESGSMKPTYKEGDLVFMTKLTDAEKAKLDVGDIITYFAPIDINNDGKTGDINTHRIVRIDHTTGTVHTQGDNKETNPVEDSYTLKYMDIIGKCTEKGRVGGLGAVIKFLRSSLGFFLCIVLPLILFFLYELYRFISLIVSERAKNAPVSSETEEEIKKKAIEEYLASQRKAEEENKNGKPEADGGVKEEKTLESSESGENKE